MSLALTAALNRRRAVRERARLNEMTHNAAALIRAQHDRVMRLEGHATPTARDIARAIEQRAKSALLNPGACA